MEKLLTVQETSDLLRISKITTYKLLEKGKLPAIKIGGQWRVKYPEVIENEQD